MAVRNDALKEQLSCVAMRAHPRLHLSLHVQPVRRLNILSFVTFTARRHLKFADFRGGKHAKGPKKEVVSWSHQTSLT